MSCGVDLCPAGTVGGIAVPEATIAMRGGAYAQPSTAVEPYGCSLAVGQQKGGGCGCNNRMYGGGCSTCLNSLLGRFRRRGSAHRGGYRANASRRVKRGGYRATKKDKAALKRFRQGKSIGFTMRSSLKAKGLIPRANGTRKVSNKYR
jgi:hypothetical protein